MVKASKMPRASYRSFSFSPVSVLTLNGRVIIPYMGYNQYVAFVRQGADIEAAKLWYDKSKQQFYLLVSLEIETAGPTPEIHNSKVPS